MKDNDLRKKQEIASDLVHEMVVLFHNQMMEKLNALTFLNDDEKWLTQQRIVNRIFVHYNSIVFERAALLTENGEF